MASPYNLPLTEAQSAVATLPLDRRAFLEGPAGTGKTRAGVARVRHLLQSGVPGDQILVILPQRTLAGPYTEMLRHPSTPAGGEVTVLTMGGLAQRMTELFWPLVSFAAGFGRPDRPPVFLTLETAQYFMARIVRPLLDDGYFDSITVDRNRLYSQILDNLAKAASVGYDYTEVGARLKAAWIGESSQLRVYDEAQECANRFRQYCLAHNLLDFSLQVEVFTRHLWPLSRCRDYLQGRYRHLVIDNTEEDTPVSHDTLLEWLPAARSALVIYDTGAGYRRFLAADPTSAYRLKDACEEHIAFTESFVMSPDVADLSERLRRVLRVRPSEAAPAPQELSLIPPPPSPETVVSGEGGGGARPALPALDYAPQRFHPQMLDWVAERIAGLVNDEGVPPSEIAVLSPFMTGGLRFSLETRLAAYGVPVRSHRPSRALAEEPATLALLTLAQLCHPHWRAHPTRHDVAHALMLSVNDMDLVRAQLLAEIAYRAQDGEADLNGFDEIEPEMQERLTFLLGGRYEGLRTWLSANAKLQAAASRAPVRDARDRKAAKRRTAELDHFLSRLFGELLSQPGYAFHGSFDAGEITANVIESARKFRQVMQLAEGEPAGGRPAARTASQPPALVPTGSGSTSAAEQFIPADLGREWVELVQDGVVAAQYIRSWQRQPEDAVLVAPAYTFLMSNRPVDHQFWLDVGSSGWWERLYQPLTQPYVLSRRWQAGAQWTDADEYAARQEALSALVIGLTRRCRVQIHLGRSQMGATGVEQRGALLRVIQQVLRNR